MLCFIFIAIADCYRGRGKNLCSPCYSTSGVRKNARFAHIMVNIGLIVREKRFSTHEAKFHALVK